MVVPDPPQPPRLVREVLGTGRIPDVMTEIFAVHFLTVHKDGGGGGLPAEKWAGRGLHSFLEHLASGVDPAAGL